MPTLALLGAMLDRVAVVNDVWKLDYWFKREKAGPWRGSNRWDGGGGER